MGLPDDYTLIDYNGKPAKDGPRYKAIGNSMAVNVMRWIGERIESVERLGLHEFAQDPKRACGGTT
jgi:DNA (cytosine-5)-methyltransferase 1